MRKLAFILPILVLLSCVEEKNESDASLDNSTIELVWQAINSPTKAHLRGLDIAVDGTTWASGTYGSVLRSLDTGKTWDHFQIANCSDIDFRDVEAFDKDFAVVMSSGNGLRIYYSVDGGNNWQLSYEDNNSAIFYDGIDFNGARGLAYGDPIDGKLAMLETVDSGKTWHAFDRTSMPLALDGEAGFAASGTGIVLGKSAIWIATGGASDSRVFTTSAVNLWKPISTPLMSAPSSGIFSMDFLNDMHGIIVGGDYIDSTRATKNAAYTMDGGATWRDPITNPHGYRSCVTFMDDGTAVATGRSGTDISYDEGQNWEKLSQSGYFSCASIGNRIIGVGRGGKIGRLELE